MIADPGFLIPDRGLYLVWAYLNDIKTDAVRLLPPELWAEVKAECDDLFRQASGGRYRICPAWIVGAL